MKLQLLLAEVTWPPDLGVLQADVKMAASAIKIRSDFEGDAAQ